MPPGVTRSAAPAGVTGGRPPRLSDQSTIDPTTGRRAMLLTFWLGLALAIVPWWLDTDAGSITGTAQTMTAVGRIAGLLGGYLLLVQVLLMSRIRSLERWIGANQLMSWHRDNGGALVVVVLAHIVFITFGYAAAHDSSVLGEALRLITTYPAMLSAFVATVILTAVALLAVQSVRRVLPHEIWYVLHVSSYAVLLLAYGHQFANGEQLLTGGLGRTYWTGLYIGVIAGMVNGRLVAPVRFNLRHQLRVEDVVAEGSDCYSIYLAGRRLDELEAEPGQFFRWRFLTRGCWWQSHPFSLSAAPNGMDLRLTIKEVGSHTAKLGRLRPGVRVYAQGPSGIFTAGRATRSRALLIAGGTGIVPIRALLEELPPGAIVIYRASTRDDLLLRDELEWWARVRRTQLYYILGARDDPRAAGFLTAGGLHELVPDVARRDVYVCGPAGFVATTVNALKRLRVPGSQIHIDPFEF